ncbi:hypothetical protein MTO96_001679 [Rhipicephalus appendiculatus]
MGAPSRSLLSSCAQHDSSLDERPSVHHELESNIFRINRALAAHACNDSMQGRREGSEPNLLAVHSAWPTPTHAAGFERSRLWPPAVWTPFSRRVRPRLRAGTAGWAARVLRARRELRVCPSKEATRAENDTSIFSLVECFHLWWFPG